LADAVTRIRALRQEFWQDVRLPGEPTNVNKELELALRLADYMEFAELLAVDAQHRRESCGCHFRDEFQTEDGEAKRNDAEYSYVAAWEFTGVDSPPVLHKEPLGFEYVSPSQRSYK
jgi:succinate dehydrogenase / fumarate reductase flavoprotein subunit